MRPWPKWMLPGTKLSATRPPNFYLSHTMGQVVVLGSLNRDCIAQVEALPPPGHTVVAKQLLYRFGGKGGNQAVAAAKQDAEVFMIGCVGDDSAGQAYVQMLNEHGINTDGVVKRAGTPTGMAMISVDAQAENTIVVCLAANDTLTADEVVAQQPAIMCVPGKLACPEASMPCACWFVAVLSSHAPCHVATKRGRGRLLSAPHAGESRVLFVRRRVPVLPRRRSSCHSTLL